MARRDELHGKSAIVAVRAAAGKAGEMTGAPVHGVHLRRRARC
jgi:hypothetical protein